MKNKPQPKPQNMVKYLDRLSSNEKAVICGVLNRMDLDKREYPEPEVHQGTLPFVNVGRVVTAMTNIVSVHPERERIYRQILTKLAEAVDEHTKREFVVATKFSMKLDDRKVYRHFGKHPERGKPMGWLGKDKIKVGGADTLVSPCVTLAKQAITGLWTVQVLKRCEYAVQLWLSDHCA
jgi:hypothetical protein